MKVFHPKISTESHLSGSSWIRTTEYLVYPPLSTGGWGLWWYHRLTLSVYNYPSLISYQITAELLTPLKTSTVWKYIHKVDPQLTQTKYTSYNSRRRSSSPVYATRCHKPSGNPPRMANKPSHNHLTYFHGARRRHTCSVHSSN